MDKAVVRDAGVLLRSCVALCALLFATPSLGQTASVQAPRQLFEVGAYRDNPSPILCGRTAGSVYRFETYRDRPLTEVYEISTDGGQELIKALGFYVGLVSCSTDGRTFAAVSVRPDPGPRTVYVQRDSEQAYYSLMDSESLQDEARTFHASTSPNARFKPGRFKLLSGPDLLAAHVAIKAQDKIYRSPVPIEGGEIVAWPERGFTDVFDASDGRPMARFTQEDLDPAGTSVIGAVAQKTARCGLLTYVWMVSEEQSWIAALERRGDRVVRVPLAGDGKLAKLDVADLVPVAAGCVVFYAQPYGPQTQAVLIGEGGMRLIDLSIDPRRKTGVRRAVLGGVSISRDTCYLLADTILYTRSLIGSDYKRELFRLAEPRGRCE